MSSSLQIKTKVPCIKPLVYIVTFFSKVWVRKKIVFKNIGYMISTENKFLDKTLKFFQDSC